MKKLSVFLFVMLLFFGFAGMANATLWDRGGGLIYDDFLDITWLQNANYAGTTMSWYAATTWAAGLEYDDSARSVTWTDWRLPTTMDGPYVYGYDGTTTAGYNITTSEMGYMYYENLGNSSSGLTNAGPFTNLQSNDYWSGTTCALYSDYAWIFGFSEGRQTFGNQGLPLFAWAVRDGDVGGTPSVPEPATMLLLGFGLAGLGIFRKKITRRHG